MRRTEVIPVEALFSVPEGMERVGDSIYDPANWVQCRACGVDCPASAEDCWHCGEPLVE